MITLSSELISLLSSEVLKTATCWSLHRSDGTVLRFTDSDTIITYDGEQYSPAGGGNASATSKLGGLQQRNRELSGVLESDAITVEDLRSGRYREACVDEYVVSIEEDPATLILHNRYWIEDVTFSDENWQATMSATPSWLTPEVGRYYNRTCEARLGDAYCNVDLAASTQSGKTVGTIITARQKFASDATGAEGFFTHGKITFTSGDNTGLTGEVKKFEADGTISLWLAMPFDIDPGDLFTIEPGCDRLASTCIDKFNNIVNFRGYPFIPGTDKAYQTPDAAE